MQPSQSIVCESAEELSGVGEVLELVVGRDWLWGACHPHVHAAGSPTPLTGHRALICKHELPSSNRTLCVVQLHAVSPQHKLQLGHGVTLNKAQYDGASRTIPEDSPELGQGLYCFPAPAC